MIDKKLNAFKNSWQFDRSLTLELLNFIDEKQLLFCPGENVGSVWKQFRHIGRVQENYLEAISTGKVNFDTAGSTYNGGCDKKALFDYLTGLDRQCLELLADERSLPVTIDWFGEAVPLADHLFRLLSHETLHHGQLIVYCRLAGWSFPPGWSIWGL